MVKSQDKRESGIFKEIKPRVTQWQEQTVGRMRKAGPLNGAPSVTSRRWQRLLQVTGNVKVLMRQDIGFKLLRVTAAQHTVACGGTTHSGAVVRSPARATLASQNSTITKAPLTGHRGGLPAKVLQGFAKFVLATAGLNALSNVCLLRTSKYY